MSFCKIKGEGIDLEFKTCRNQLTRDIYETVCAFLNRHGGTLLLGVKDDGTIEGIAPDAIEQIRKDFVTAINNPQKLIPPTYLSINEIDQEGKKLGLSEFLKGYYPVLFRKSPGKLFATIPRACHPE